MSTGIKHLHMMLALISILGFLARAAWLLHSGQRPGSKLAKILPHVIDTLLLLSGLTLLAMASWAWLSTPWMLVKLLLVALYIGLGIVAFRMPTRTTQAVLIGLATLTFIQVMAIAFQKSPFGLFSGLI